MRRTAEFRPIRRRAGRVVTIDEEQPRQGPILVALALAGFVTALDNNVVNVALPTMGRDLGASVTQLEWIISSYVLSFASLLITGGRVTDLWGRRRVLLAGLVLLIATAVAAGAATSAAALIVARVAQGAAAALVMPAALAVLARDVDDAHRDLASGVWTASLAAALALGPVVGGVLTEHLTWSWIFFLHVPAGALTVALVRRGLPSGGRERRRPSPRELDPGGLLLAAVVLGGTSFALVQGQSLGFRDPLIMAAALAVLVCLPALTYVERRASSPMLDFDLFRNRVFTGGTLAQVLWGLGVNGTFLYTSLFLQNVLRFSPSGAGALFVPLAGVLVLSVPFVPALTARFAPQWIVTAGMALVALGLALLALSGTASGVWPLLPGLLSIGLGSGLITPLTSAVLTSVDPHRAGVASAMVSAGREASSVLGVAVIGAVIGSVQAQAQQRGITGAPAYLEGYSIGLWIAAGLVLLGAFVTAVTLRPGGARRAQLEPVRERHRT